MEETPADVVPVEVAPIVPSDNDAPLHAGGPLAEDDIDAFLPESDLDLNFSFVLFFFFPFFGFFKEAKRELFQSCYNYMKLCIESPSYKQLYA